MNILFASKASFSRVLAEVSRCLGMHSKKAREGSDLGIEGAVTIAEASALIEFACTTMSWRKRRLWVERIEIRSRCLNPSRLTEHFLLCMKWNNRWLTVAIMNTMWTTCYLRRCKPDHILFTWIDDCAKLWVYMTVCSRVANTWELKTGLSAMRKRLIFPHIFLS